MPLLKDKGIKTIICNRPDHEDEKQPTSEELSKAAEQYGMKLFSLPIAKGAKIPPSLIKETHKILHDNEPSYLFFCGSGKRAKILWTIVSHVDFSFMDK